MAERHTVTVTETVHVDRPPDEVFDYTQDYSTRPVWDASIKSAEKLSDEPRRFRVRMPGVGEVVIEYKLFRRGERTSAAFTDIKSTLFAGGGGSWRYEQRDGGTEWTETNTLEFKNRIVGSLMAPMVRRNMAKGMRTAMAKAKSIMESAPSGN